MTNIRIFFCRHIVLGPALYNLVVHDFHGIKNSVWIINLAYGHDSRMTFGTSCDIRAYAVVIYAAFMNKLLCRPQWPYKERSIREDIRLQFFCSFL